MFLVDASVWIALERPQDSYHAEARSLVRDFDRPLAALDLTLYEVANVAAVKMGQPDRGRFLAELILTRCRDRFLRVDSDLLVVAMEIAVEYDLSAYDAAYVAAARRNDWTLVSADIRDLVSKGLAVAPDAADYP